MTTVGYATLSVIPEMKGVRASLEKQSAAGLAAAGKSGGRKYGDAAGTAAASGFRGKFSSAMKGFAPLAGVLAGAGVVGIFKGAIEEAREAAKVHRVTAKLIETTGNAANVSSEQMGKLTESLMDYAAVDDELIQSGANVLLTFKNVQNQIGEGNAIFDRATKAGLDLAAVLGTDISGSALQLGKALNDPVKGMTALGRAGVQFTAAQKEQIKGLVQTGDLLSAQRIILTEVEGQVGGAAGAAADETARMSVAFGNLKESLGAELMPAVTAFSNWAIDDGIPALTALGGLAKDAVVGFAGLPGPVKTATAAFVALRIAAAAGLGTLALGGIAAVGSAFTSLRIRVLLAGDAFRKTSGSGLAASLAAIRAGAIGAGAAFKSLSLAVLPIAVITGAVTAWSKFSQGQEEAKQRVQEMTAALDKETGALTDQNKELVFQALQQSKAFDIARKYGIALTDVRDAALGNEDALSRVNGVLDRAGAAFEAAGASQSRASRGLSQFSLDATHLREAIGGQNAEVEQSIANFDLHAEVMGDSAGATRSASTAIRDYAGELRSTRSELRKLIEAEAERALQNIQNRRDAIALRETFRAAREEAGKGKDVLFDNSKAADANMAALLDLGEQWNNSSKKVTDAKGAYGDMRRQFIEVATSMGATKQQAIDLAKEILKVPRTADIRFQSKNFRQVMAELKAVKDEISTNAFRVIYSSQASGKSGESRGFATGGMIGGYGSGTSDSNLIWASKGEFMQRKAAVDYYGVEFMRKLNALQVPRIPGYAQGGAITQVAAADTGPMFDFRGSVIQQPDPRAFLNYMQRRSAQAGTDRVRSSR